MENNTDNNGFVYTYSSKEQDELKRIRDKYINKEEDKLDKLHRLDHSVTERAQIGSLTIGIIGSLILGTGMSLCMTELADMLGSLKGYAMLIGILIGLLGGALVALAYPLYNYIIKRERKRIAPEIIRLTDELMK